MLINKCPPGNLQSFPIKAGFQVTDTTFTNANKTPMNIKFSWGQRTTAPNFSYAGSGIIDHTQNDTTSTMTYNSALYILGSVQLTAPSHNNWLTPTSLDTTKMDNVEDIIITFQRDMYAPESDKDPAFIILVNPILRNISQNGNPVYLTNMADGVASPVTLESIFPYISTNSYVYYTTCVNGLTTQDPYKNILVLLNVQGMVVSATIMTKIKDMYNKFSQGDYPQYIPLGNFNTHTDEKESIQSLREGFQGNSAGVTAPVVPITGGSGPPTATRFVADKCVPFDPETQVDKDGIIVLTGDKSQPIQSIINTRTVEKKNWFSFADRKGKLNLSDVEEKFVYILVGVLGLTILSGVVGFFTGLSGLSDLGLKFFTTTTIGIGCFIGGFFLGIYTFPANCK